MVARPARVSAPVATGSARDSAQAGRAAPTHRKREQPVSVAPTAFPYKLRLEHEGRVSVRLERAGRYVCFDPIGPPVGAALEGNEILVLTWAWPEHLEAAAERVRAGARPTVVAEPEVLAWLAARGPIDAHRAPVTLDGVSIETRVYEPIPYATPSEAAWKVRSALLRPDRAAGRLLRKARLPRVAPTIVQLTLPSGERVLHLNLSLHSRTPEPWLADVSERFGGADYVLVGVDHGEGDAVLRHLPRFSPKRVLFTDLISEIRREVGMPTSLLTPVCDEAIAQGMQAYLFVGGAGMRFE